ncbi:MAG: trigger factor [Sphingomonadaceae bacterium]|nr:trigger factor [Sphingomonadaceae bacterium]
MQTVETLNEGLRRGYTLTIAAKDIDARVDARLKAVAPQVRMPGFRPGKVPANLVRKMHGAQLQQEALQEAVQQSVQSLISEHQLRPAMQPSVELDESYEPGKDAAVTVSLEVLPQVPTPSIDDLKLERLTVEADDAAVSEQLHRFAESQKHFEAAPEGHPAVEGDLVVMDFAGTSGGVAFEGGTGTGMSVELGSGRLIPGFEEQLEGVKVGESRTLDVTFPKDYPEKKLAGKPATFEVTVTEVKVPGETKIDDEFAKSMGLQDLEQLKGLFKGQIEQELNGLTRTHMKRKLLDQLAEAHDFPVPPTMVEAEFQQIWRQLEHEATHEADVEAAKAELEKDRDDYRAIAERRVRLGLLLSEIGQANGVEVSGQEMQRLIAQAAQQYRPEDRERFAQYITNDPMAAAQLRAPLYEDKVVDFLFAKAEVSDRSVTREELEAAIEADDGFASGTHVHSHDHDHDHHDHGDEGHVHGPDCDHDHDHDHAEPAAKAKRKPAAKKAAAAEPAASSDEAVIETKAAKPTPKKAAAKAADAEPAAAAEAEPAAKPAAKKPAAAKKVTSETQPEAPAPEAAAEEAAPKPKRKPATKKAEA